jgi:hypothetical protein
MPSYLGSGTTISFFVVSVFMWIAIVASYIICLVLPSDYELRKPSRWAGLNSNGIWWPWLVLIVLMLLAYFTFLIMFVIDEEQAGDNHMHAAVFYVNVLFFWSGVAWPYLLRRVELGGERVSGTRSGGCYEWLELIFAFPFSLLPEVRKGHVWADLIITFLFSAIMLMLFCIGAAESGFSDAEVVVACALAYMALYLLVVDGMFWGYTWYYELYEKPTGPSQVGGMPADSDASSVLWSDVKLLPVRGARPQALRLSV